MVGERIRYYRKRQKMTLRELGEKSGFENRGDVRIAQYENGSRVPKTGTLNRIYVPWHLVFRGRIILRT